jgi:RNase P protein component
MHDNLVNQNYSVKSSTQFQNVYYSTSACGGEKMKIIYARHEIFPTSGTCRAVGLKRRGWVWLSQQPSYYIRCQFKKERKRWGRDWTRFIHFTVDAGTRKRDV